MTPEVSPGLVIGAGIAGLATAIFAKEYGLSVTLLERSQEISCDEHLLWIAPNGLHILKKMGLLDAVLKAAMPQEGMIFATQNLSSLMTLSGDSLRRSCDYPIVAVRRRDLWLILERRWRDMGEEILFGHVVQKVDSTDKMVSVDLTGRKEPLKAPWVIGADGMGSQVRTTVAPQSALRYQGIRTWLGTAVTPVAERYVGRTIEAWGKGTRFVLTSMDGCKVHFSALERPSDYERNGAPIPVDTLERLQGLFASYHPDVSNVLKAADPASLVRCNFGVVDGLKEPFRGAIAVIGDAAHGMPPNMGQGASLGLEDALWIVQALKCLKDPETAFRAYGQGRKKRVYEMRTLANSMNSLFQPQNSVACLARNTLAGLIPDRLTALRMGQLYQPAWPSFLI